MFLLHVIEKLSDTCNTAYKKCHFCRRVGGQEKNKNITEALAAHLPDEQSINTH